MRDEKNVFQLLGETSGSINPLARDIMLAEFEKYFSEQRFYGPVFLAYQGSPEPLTVGRICQRTPYTNPDAVAGTLDAAAEAGYLEKKDSGDYFVSDKGTDAIDAVHMTFYKKVNQMNQFPGEKMSSLEALLEKLVDSVNLAELKSGSFSFKSSNGGHPQVKAGTLARVDQFIDDLFAFRDDTHIEAWTPSGVSGQVWETLSFVWNGEANTAEKLAERLAVRNYSQEDYQAALDKLADKGWIEAGDEGYVVTDGGKKIREDAEEDTNTIFFNPWKVLDDSELDQLGELLSELKEINLGLVEEEQAD